MSAQNTLGQKNGKRKTPADPSAGVFMKQGYLDSNQEMTESESVALPFGDSPLFTAALVFISSDENYYNHLPQEMQAFFTGFKNFLFIRFYLFCQNSQTNSAHGPNTARLV